MDVKHMQPGTWREKGIEAMSKWQIRNLWRYRAQQRVICAAPAAAKQVKSLAASPTKHTGSPKTARTRRETRDPTPGLRKLEWRLASHQTKMVQTDSLVVGTAGYVHPDAEQRQVHPGSFRHAQCQTSAQANCVVSVHQNLQEATEHFHIGSDDEGRDSWQAGGYMSQEAPQRACNRRFLRYGDDVRTLRALDGWEVRDRQRVQVDLVPKGQVGKFIYPVDILNVNDRFGLRDYAVVQFRQCDLTFVHTKDLAVVPRQKPECVNA